MALVTIASTASMDAASGGLAPHLSDGLVAGEALLAAAPCYVKASDGLVYMSNGTAATEAASCFGFTARATAAGQPVSLFSIGTKFEYASGMTPGAKLYVGTTAGRLDTAATTGGTVAVARAYDATHIQVIAIT
jgi:hypothetical protein